MIVVTGADGPTPFRGRIVRGSPPMRVLHRFVKLGHVAEIRERKVTTFRAIEFIVYVDGSLIESELFHGARLPAYREAIEARIKQFTDAGWIQEQSTDAEAH